jgi:hypothetical protein
MAEKQIENKELKNTYELAEVPTQTAIVIRNMVTGDVMSEAQALAQILNDINIIKRSVA